MIFGASTFRAGLGLVLGFAGLAGSSLATPWARAEATNPALAGLDFSIFDRARIATWDPGLLSDPAEKPRHYRYLVHAVNEKGKPLSLEKYFSQEFLDRSDLVSLSLISDEKNATWGPAGFIMITPETNILAMRQEDMFSQRFSSAQTLQEKQAVLADANAHSIGVVSPEELLAKTDAAYRANNHNEVLALAKGLEGQTLKVSGVFVKVDSLGNSWVTPENQALLRSEAEHRGVPLLEVDPPQGIRAILGTVSIDPASQSWLNFRLSCSRIQLESILAEGLPTYGVTRLNGGFQYFKLTATEALPPMDGYPVLTLEFEPG